VQKHRYKVSFLLTALLYIVPVIAYLYFLKQAIVSSSQPQKETIELALSRFVPEAPAADVPEPVQQEYLVEEIPKPEEKVEKEEEAEEEVIEEEVPEPEPEEKPVEQEPEPIVKETPLPKQVKKVVEKPLKKPLEKPVKKQKKPQKKKRVHRKREISGGGSPHYSAAQKNHFLAMIRQKIDRAKSYPRIARKKGMQGVVRVSFTILSDGHVGKIRISGPRIFHKSARQAIQRAFPVDVKKAPLRLPATVNLSLRYKLR